MFKTLSSWLHKLLSCVRLSKPTARKQPSENTHEKLAIDATSTTSSLTKEHRLEKDKVRARLERWSTHQDQINSRILNAYLRLERNGYNPITISMLRNQLLDIPTFTSNFDQMKIISPHNHAKVFEVNGEEVTIWHVVEVHVREYERQILG